MPLRARNDAAEIRIQLLKLRAVIDAARSVIGCVSGIGIAERGGNRAAYQLRVDGGGPDVLVVLLVLVLVVVMVLMHLHPVLDLLGQRVHAVEHHNGGYLLAHVAQNLVKPRFGFAAVADEQIAVLDADDVLRRRLIAVRFGAGRDEQGHVPVVPCDLAGKVVGRENGTDDIQPLSPALRRRFAACAETEDQAYNE